MTNTTFNQLTYNGVNSAKQAQLNNDNPAFAGLEPVQACSIATSQAQANGLNIQFKTPWETLAKNPSLGMGEITKVNKSTVKFTRDLSRINQNVWNVTITKTSKGFHYRDIGDGNTIDIDFPTAERLCWEFEYPKSLKRVLRKLKA